MWHQGSRARPEERTTTASGFVASASVHSTTGRAAELCPTPVRAATDHADGRLSARTWDAVWVRPQSTDADTSRKCPAGRLRSDAAISAIFRPRAALCSGRRDLDHKEVQEQAAAKNDSGHLGSADRRRNCRYRGRVCAAEARRETEPAERQPHRHATRQGQAAAGHRASRMAGGHRRGDRRQRAQANGEAHDHTSQRHGHSEVSRRGRRDQDHRHSGVAR